MPLKESNAASIALKSHRAVSSYRARQSASFDPFAKAVDGEPAIGRRLLAR